MRYVKWPLHKKVEGPPRKSKLKSEKNKTLKSERQITLASGLFAPVAGNLKPASFMPYDSLSAPPTTATTATEAASSPSLTA
ncbi:MAG: hypothetical protein ABUM51_08285, partial [Bacteroidota bacterium]